MMVGSFFVVKVKGGVRQRTVKAKKDQQGATAAVFLLIGRQCVWWGTRLQEILRGLVALFAPSPFTFWVYFRGWRRFAD